MSLSVAMLSVHTSPLDRPGRTKDAGGMNVYMRELARELGNRHKHVDIFTRWTNEQTPHALYISAHMYGSSTFRAGALSPLHKNDLYQYLPEFIHNIDEFRRTDAKHYDILHSHYWLSGVAASQLALRWNIPHVTMFHTLGRLKQLANPNEPEPALAPEMEQQLIQQADRIIAATAEERTAD